MRLLVTGTHRATNLALALELCRTQSIGDSDGWTVVTSYEASFQKWVHCDNVGLVKLYKSLGHDQPAEPLILEVKASSFFDQDWVRERLHNAENLLIITESPLVLGNPSIFETFDRFYITKTSSAEKQGRYHKLFANPQTCELKTFKKAIKSLDPMQYLTMTFQGAPGKQLVEEAGNPVRDPVPLTETTKETKFEPKGNFAEPAESGFDFYQQVMTKEPSADPLTHLSKDKHLPPQKKNVEEEKKKPEVPRETPLTEEVWVELHKTPKRSLQEIQSLFESMLGKPLLLPMIESTGVEKDDQRGVLNVKFCVYSHRCDIFVSLLFNLMQALKGAGGVRESHIVVK